MKSTMVLGINAYHADVSAVFGCATLVVGVTAMPRISRSPVLKLPLLFRSTCT